MQTGLERLQRTAAYAETKNARILLENLNKEPPDAEVHYLAHTIEEWRWYYEKIDSPAFALSFTANHAHLVPEGVDGFLREIPLHRVAEVTLRGHAAPDADAPRLQGAGTVADPFVVPSLPFADTRDTSAGGSRVFARYPCDAAADESGPEFVYRITVTRPTALRAMVVTRGSTDVDLQLLDRTATAASCSARDDRVITTTLQPGTWHLTVDTYVDAAGTHSGEYVLVLVDDG
jgi:hypothetical protein